jgi:DinB superfamily
MIDTAKQQEIQWMQSKSRCMVLRSELEATRAGFHRLLDTVSKAAWRLKSPSSQWTVVQVFVHLTWALEYLPEEVQSARRGRGMFNLPKRLADLLSYWYIRWIARKVTPDSIGRRYDQAMDASISLLSTIPDSEWRHGADFYGEGFHTVEDLFHVPARHLAEHTAGSHPESSIHSARTS